MHFSTSLYLFGFLTLGAAFPEGVLASGYHQHFHRRHAQVEGIVPVEVTLAKIEPAVVEPARVEPATVQGPPNNAVVDVSTPPNNALVIPTPITTSGIPVVPPIVPTTLATVVKVSDSSTILASPSMPLPTSEVYVVPTAGGTHEGSSGSGIAPTTTCTATGETVVSSAPVTIVKSSVITTESTGTVTSTHGASISNSSSSSINAPTTLDTTSTSLSTGVNATTTLFPIIASNVNTDSITSTPTTSSSSPSKEFVTATSTSTTFSPTRTAAWSTSMKISFKYSTLVAATHSTTHKLTLATPSTAPPEASQSKGLDMAEFNKTKPCFDKKCDDPGSEMTYNKTITFNIDNGGDGGVKFGKGSGVSSAAPTGFKMGVAALVVVGFSVVLTIL
ncbi:hypothetical protein L873DRAFT_1686337 [Choiromyces venosus 120613-1]|uniref:Uncharacterized protein n=1 Tax=Choiromyces venosus 120613-1 TaxID=1336337 RepID=A0A3N4JKF7_9PEZI|nr:hypothetical protein L873DRAFT_1686337 [Choiromyces venosus 120613-1]